MHMTTKSLNRLQKRANVIKLTKVMKISYRYDPQIGQLNAPPLPNIEDSKRNSENTATQDGKFVNLHESVTIVSTDYC